MKPFGRGRKSHLGIRIGMASIGPAVMAVGFVLAWPQPLMGGIPRGNIFIKLETVASGLPSPLFATHAGDGSGRLFIVDQSGKIFILKNGAILSEPFLDISAELPALQASGDERGLLGLAFHPEYAKNGRFFVRHSKPRSGSAGELCLINPTIGCHEEVLAEYRVSKNPDVANPTGQILFRVDWPEQNHNGGHVAFGPDGLLYFSLGDGGGGRDGMQHSPPTHGPIGHGQSIEVFWGKVHRIDVDSGSPYAIPSDNPFANTDGLDEIYAYGFRNPYRFSFDSRPGGDGRLILADVGERGFEEIDFVEAGGNYGWVIKEGLHCFDPLNPNTPLASCNESGLIDPIAEYARSEGGISVIGGFVYRGSRSPRLFGKYVFGDFFKAPSGRLYYLNEPFTGVFEIKEFTIAPGNRQYGLFLKGFGQDENGEIYACGSSSGGPSGAGGLVQRIVAVPAPGRPPVSSGAGPVGE